MKIDKIKEAVNSNLPHSTVRMLVLDIISKDEDALTDMLKIIDSERTRKRELLLEMNMQLSRAHVALQTESLRKDDFIVNEISNFYNNQDQIGHCFQNYDQRNKKT